jgi:hypothetical protein
VSQNQHAIFLNHRSTHEDHNKIYFTNFGALNLKIWFLESFSHFLEIHFINQFSETGWKVLEPPGAMYTRAHTETDRRDPAVNWPHWSVTPEQGSRLTDGISPLARWPATRWPPTCSMAQGEHDRVSGEARGARNRAYRRAWRHGGVAHRWENVSGHGVARGVVSEHRETERARMRVKSGREGEQKGDVHRARFSGELGRDSGE